ncbi:hypothetical protein K438DRAFT_1987582 [Mycena galopus ATCC 62051]|nr:hypothetical protein K438DRAFT_1987582 [Mycena galopus ATCC 62051]
MSPQPVNGKPAPKRKRNAPKHLLDDSNSEAPSAAHQAIVDATQTRLNVAGAIAKLIKNIEDLDAVLPTTVAQGTDEDEIHRVLTTIHGLDSRIDLHPPLRCSFQGGRTMPRHEWTSAPDAARRAGHVEVLINLFIVGT